MDGWDIKQRGGKGIRQMDCKLWEKDNCNLSWEMLLIFLKI